MKEHPILFSTDMVKAILDGRKTQTRRVIKLKEYDRSIWDSCVPHNKGRDGFLGEPYLKVPYDPIVDNAGNRITCPYGQVGDRLWVRETWATGKGWGDSKPSELPPNEVRIYTKDDPLLRYGYAGKWRPSIHMPRWASRITLEITEVRVERVQEIEDTEDLLNEGMTMYPANCESDYYPLGPEARSTNEFKELWDSLNAKRGYGWNVNPWVWVIGFKESK